MCRNTAATMIMALQKWMARIMKPKGICVMICATLTHASDGLRPKLPYCVVATSAVEGTYQNVSRMPEMAAMTKLSSARLPSVYMGYQYQIERSLYFSVWERGSCMLICM